MEIKMKEIPAKYILWGLIDKKDWIKTIIPLNEWLTNAQVYEIDDRYGFAGYAVFVGTENEHEMEIHYMALKTTSNLRIVRCVKGIMSSMRKLIKGYSFVAKVPRDRPVIIKLAERMGLKVEVLD